MSVLIPPILTTITEDITISLMSTCLLSVLNPHENHVLHAKLTYWHLLL